LCIGTGAACTSTTSTCITTVTGGEDVSHAIFLTGTSTPVYLTGTTTVLEYTH
jgi:hypothetical protein